MQVSEELSCIHKYFATADEAYREFRAMLMQDIGEDPGFQLPIEWIPISAH